MAIKRQAKLVKSVSAPDPKDDKYQIWEIDDYCFEKFGQRYLGYMGGSNAWRENLKDAHNVREHVARTMCRQKGIEIISVE